MPHSCERNDSRFVSGYFDNGTMALSTYTTHPISWTTMPVWSGQVPGDNPINHPELVSQHHLYRAQYSLREHKSNPTRHSRIRHLSPKHQHKVYLQVKVASPAAAMLGLHRHPKPIYTPSATSAASQPLPSPMVKVLLDSYDNNSFDQSADALTSWLNSRWRKSGNQVSRETVAFTLRLNGRDARLDVDDKLDGAFHRAIGAC